MIDRFVDTSGWAEWADRSLIFHAQAVACFDEVWKQNRRFVTTSYVLTELSALLTRPLKMPKSQQIQLMDDLRADPSVEIVHIDEALEEAAWELWKSHDDKSWSVVDCASFVVMRKHALTEAITTDHHFEQAGFVRLLESTRSSVGGGVASGA